MPKFDSSVAVVGIVKDVAASLQSDLNQIKSALSDFKEVKWFLVESNSNDNSKLVLKNQSNLDHNFHFTSIKTKLSKDSRIPGMSEARNRYLEELRANPIFQDCDYVVIADFNGLNDKINRTAVASCFSRSDWDICCANQDGPYYDVWALRHPLWSPNDCWRELEFLRKFIKYPEKALYAAVQSRMIRIPKDAEWIEVDSAFGGFAIYKKYPLLNASYNAFDQLGNIICEHVPLNMQLRNNGARIFINPALVNTSFTDHNLETTLKFKILRQLKYPIKWFRSKYGG